MTSKLERVVIDLQKDTNKPRHNSDLLNRMGLSTTELAVLCASLKQATTEHGLDDKDPFVLGEILMSVDAVVSILYMGYSLKEFENKETN